MTRQRALILDIMREKSPQHLTADELFNEARLRMPHIARGTVYRNLKMMELNGVVGHLEMPEGPDRYDYNPSPHGHLLCDGCGNLADLPVVGLMREVEAAIGTEVCGYTLTIHYLCPKCRTPKPGDGQS
ncbi:MAG: transcriptional repressor [Gemmiger sp.]|jgi:Fe2+ or Zn2+ uptake regulation protein|uniref:Fur family transcriptional regulator n=1 Tax=Gemmiger sp. TaxID=2049027 RepID=UPI002A7F9591|nr:transcriptional repressor [Gemmiger sp.]MCI6141441.1 transcriptional repressor [Subdoligranulum variabile]MDD6425339.1 transcriptional repressor [Subdoligranulum variabile]MDD6609332.1 transcriptional repressor [Subdoligranulum variabile]MDY4448671.1 transcriptional repressor [Gemmiger sp.]MDY5203948.1 transcriptional repressor [Gemmiger sp.]